MVGPGVVGYGGGCCGWYSGWRKPDLLEPYEDILVELIVVVISAWTQQLWLTCAS